MTTDQPIITLDLCCLRSHSKLRVFAKRHFALPNAIVSEIAGSNQAEILADRLQDLIATNPNYIWAGKDWNEIVEEERSPHTKTIGRGWINYCTTNKLTLAAQSPEVSFKANLAGFDELNMKTTYENKRSTFIDICKDCAEYLSRNNPELVQILTDGNGKWELMCDQATYSDAIANVAPIFVPKQIQSRLKSDSWQNCLRSNPDDYAISRWSKIILWYSLLWTSGSQKDFDNHWDDTQYAFLASYTKYISTSDKILSRCIKDLFPDVNIIEL